MFIPTRLKSIAVAAAFLAAMIGLPAPTSGPRQEAASPSPHPAALRMPAATEAVRIRKALDGDTVELDDGRRVRYIGIDTPEMQERFHTRARRLNATLVEGREAWLEFDVEKTDAYGRLLAYVYFRDDGELRMINAELIRRGMARLYTPGLNEKHKALLTECQQEARGAKRGIWSRETGAGGPFVATRQGHAFHRPDCPELESIPAKALLHFDSRGKALDGGRSPCRTCKP